MIDYSISDSKKKFELIWSCILKVMIFTILSNFLEFFWNYLSLFSIFNWFKTIKKGKNGIFIARDPCGCDVARKAMWQSYADPRECLRGTDVTCIYIIFIYT